MPSDDITDLTERLERFCRAKVGDDAVVSEVAPMGGHAGFAYGFAVTQAGETSRWFLRLPPPKGRWEGTADMGRQVCALQALDGTAVPHCPVRWHGGPNDPGELDWFGRPYYVVPQLGAGSVIGMGGSGWVQELTPQRRSEMGRQAVGALAEIHRVDWRTRCGYLGDPVPLLDDVTRWDRLVAKAADPALLGAVPTLRERLLATAPAEAPVGLFHGDFQFGNLWYDPDGTLTAVLDWELTGIGATLADIGWLATFNDPVAWNHHGAIPAAMPRAEELVEGYEAAIGRRLPDIAWFRALAAYKFSIIAAFNLGLHRRGSRPDSLWERIGQSIPSLQARAADLLSS